MVKGFGCSSPPKRPNAGSCASPSTAGASSAGSEFSQPSLEEARTEALKLRRAARDGKDLQADERGARPSDTTFAQAFEEFFELKRQQLANSKHIQQWQNTMRDYVFPIIGDRPVAEITPREVLAVLQPIWSSKLETASRVLQRLGLTDLESDRSAARRKLAQRRSDHADRIRPQIGQWPDHAGYLGNIRSARTLWASSRGRRT